MKITKDEEAISSLFANENYCLKLVLNSNSKNSVSNINLNKCKVYTGKTDRQNINFNTTLDDLLEYFSSCEEKGNEWRCDKCKKTVIFTKKISLFYLPRILIICIDRFSKGEFKGYAKNNVHIDFPIENLDMGKYICQNRLDKDCSKYDLFAVSQHYGGTGGGHYTAVCKNYDGNWYSYNDSIVSPTSPGKVVDSSAYILFYRRKNW